MFFILIKLSILCHCFLVCRVSTEMSVHRLMGVSVIETCCFSLVDFNILSLSSIFAILTMTCLFRPSGVDPCLDSLYFLELDVCFLSQVKDIFRYYVFIYVLSHFLFSPSRIPTMQRLVHLMQPQRFCKLCSFLQCVSV